MDHTGVYHFEVKQYELDYRQALPLGVLYRFLQEAAEQHAFELGFDAGRLLKQGLTWFLFRLQLRVVSYPVGRQGITVETWHLGSESRYAFRDFRLMLPGSSSPFAVASSVWFLIDVDKGRPVVVQDVLGRPLTGRIERIVPEPFPRLSVAGTATLTKQFPVRLADVDLNGHVNNLHYAEWLSEGVPEDVWRKHAVQSLDLEYQHAVRYGDTVTLDTYPAGDLCSLHRMRSMQSGTGVLQARTTWMPL